MTKLTKRQKIERVQENGLTFIVCYRCGGSWLIDNLSKWIESSNGTMRKRLHFPKPKCPECD